MGAGAGLAWRRRGQERGRALYPLPGGVAAMLVAGAAIGIWKLRS